MSEYKDKLSGFAERLKTNQITPPMQEVKPIKTNLTNEPEIQLNIWIPKSLMKKIKQKSLDEDISIKDLVTASIKSYLQKCS